MSDVSSCVHKTEFVLQKDHVKVRQLQQAHLARIGVDCNKVVLDIADGSKEVIVNHELLMAPES